MNILGNFLRDETGSCVSWASLWHQGPPCRVMYAHVDDSTAIFLSSKSRASTEEDGYTFAGLTQVFIKEPQPITSEISSNRSVFSTLFKWRYKARVSVQSHSFLRGTHLYLSSQLITCTEGALIMLPLGRVHGPLMLGYFPLTYAVHTHVFRWSKDHQFEPQSQLGTSHPTQLHST